MDCNRLETALGLSTASTAKEIHSSVSLEAEIPEVLYRGMKEFIYSHPSWDQCAVMTSALANFLFQNGKIFRY